MVEDLQPCTYFPFVPAKLVAVGWLERGKAYSRVGLPQRPAAPKRRRWFFQRTRSVTSKPGNGGSDARAAHQRLGGVYEQLSLMLERPWQPGAFGGFHECDLCRFKSEACGTVNLFIPGNGVIYVCPELIVHYINAHEYVPPDEFCRAVDDCPPIGSDEYFDALRSCGGGSMLRPSGGEV